MNEKIDLTKITHNAYVDQYFSKHGIYCNGGLSKCDKRCIFNLTRIDEVYEALSKIGCESEDYQDRRCNFDL